MSRGFNLHETLNTAVTAARRSLWSDEDCDIIIPFAAIRLQTATFRRLVINSSGRSCVSSPGWSSTVSRWHTSVRPAHLNFRIILSVSGHLRAIDQYVYNMSISPNWRHTDSDFCERKTKWETGEMMFVIFVWKMVWWFKKINKNKKLLSINKLSVWAVV